LEKLHTHGTTFRAWERVFPREKRSLRPAERRIAWRAWERRS